MKFTGEGHFIECLVLTPKNFLKGMLNDSNGEVCIYFRVVKFLTT